MSEIKKVFYKSLELKRESPLHTRPVKYQIKDTFRDRSSEDKERDLGEHVLDCELYERNVPQKRNNEASSGDWLTQVTNNLHQFIFKTRLISLKF